MSSKKPETQSIERKLHNYRRLVEITKIINSTFDLNQLLYIIMEMIKEIMETDTSTLYQYDEENNDLVFSVVLGEAGRELKDTMQRVKIGHGIAGWVAENRKTIYINDVYNDERFDPSYDRVSGYKSRSILCAPLINKDKLLGVIQALNPTKKEYFDDQDDIELFEAFANQAAIALENASLYTNLEKKVQQRTEELEQAYKRLKELDQAKTDFFTNISHELRTPLTLILSPMEAIMQGDYGESLLRDSDVFKSIHENSVRLLRLINNLLDFSKVEAGRMSVSKQRSDISKLLKFYSSSMKAGAEAGGLSIDFIDDTDGVAAWIDQNLFEKAVFNLISNAMKFTPEGGKITIRLDRNDGSFSISVKDTGIGIPKEKQEMIFDRFTQADASLARKYSGTGIGLSLANEIIKLHDGSIKLESEPGKGSDFIITMPVIVEETMKAAEVSENTEIGTDTNPYLWEKVETETVNMPEKFSDEKQENKSGTILIAEDSSEMQKFLYSLLKKDYNILSAYNGKEALNILYKDKITPDLVLADIMMPEMDGYELTESIRANPALEGLPVILLTAKSEIPMKIKGIETGANDYIVKPFNPKELRARIESQIELKQLRDKLLNANKYLKQTLDDSSIMVANFGHKIYNELWPFAKIIMICRKLFNELDSENPSVNKEDFEFAESALQKCEQSLEKIESMKNQLKKNFGKRSEKAFNNIKYIIDDILNNYAETFANENITIDKTYDFDPSMEIKISPEQIHIALENLFNNSIHAYNSVKNFKRDKIIKINADFTENKFRMKIEDNGPGMPPDVSKDIFSMFFSMKDKESAKGLGIGLYITRWIIEDCHKGRIDVESGEGEFTRFIITLPVDGDKI